MHEVAEGDRLLVVLCSQSTVSVIKLLIRLSLCLRHGRPLDTGRSSLTVFKRNVCVLFESRWHWTSRGDRSVWSTCVPPHRAR